MKSGSRQRPRNERRQRCKRIHGDTCLDANRQMSGRRRTTRRRLQRQAGVRKTARDDPVPACARRETRRALNREMPRRVVCGARRGRHAAARPMQAAADARALRRRAMRVVVRRDWMASRHGASLGTESCMVGFYARRDNAAAHSATRSPASARRAIGRCVRAHANGRPAPRWCRSQPRDARRPAGAPFARTSARRRHRRDRCPSTARHWRWTVLLVARDPRLHQRVLDAIDAEHPRRIRGDDLGHLAVEACRARAVGRRLLCP